MDGTRCKHCGYHDGRFTVCPSCKRPYARLEVRSRTITGEGGTFRVFDLHTVRPSGADDFLSELAPIDDDGERVAQRIADAWNEDVAPEPAP